MYTNIVVSSDVFFFFLSPER